MSGANNRSVLARFCDNNWEKGKYFVKTFCVKKTCVGEGEERKRALDDVFGIWVTVRSCCLPCQILYKPKKIFAERGKG